MDFEIDNQTKIDLDIVNDDYGSKSIYSLFNNLKTKNGKEILYTWISSPTSDIEFLKERTKTIKYLYDSNVHIKLNYQQFDFIEHYLRSGRIPLRDNWLDSFNDRFKDKVRPTNDYYIIQTAIHYLVDVKDQIEIILNDLHKDNSPEFILDFYNLFIEVKDIIDKNIKWTKTNKIRYRYINRLDTLFRRKHINTIHKFLDRIYQLECYYSIALSIDEFKLTFAEYDYSSKPQVILKSLFHPFIDEPICNDMEFGSEKNLCFLTGPNMAGKSTFLKSVGVSIYLAHIGFPVPAKYMKTTIFRGLITTINLSDNINRGYSHYYSEVKRVKDTATKMLEKNRIMVIFDELFRGTNVKDAFEASYEVTNSLSQISDCLFMISTHINEIADKLGDNKNIFYKYLNSTLVNDEPVYDYKLKDGVSSERLGMKIIKREKILDILNQAIERQKTIKDLPIVRNQ